MLNKWKIHKLDNKKMQHINVKEKLNFIIVVTLMFPNMFHQVCSKLLMNFSCMHNASCLQVCDKVRRNTTRYFNIWNVIIYVIIINIDITTEYISFVFDNHVMQYNACQHYILLCIHAPGTRWTTYNCESRFEHTKCLFHILSRCFLTFCK